MCRFYKTKKGDYVRLCAYHGERRGERISFFDLPKDVADAFLERKIYHIPKAKRAQSKSYNLERMRKEPVRCRKCRAPLNRANYEIGLCDLCQRGR